LDWLASNWNEKVVFVGDYINRGTNSFGVMERLVSQSALWDDRLILLLGNHEASLLDFLDTGSPGTFLRHGGLQTANSYLRAMKIAIGDRPLSDFREQFPSDHRQLLNDMRIYYETPEILVTHAGFDPRNPESRSLESVVLGRHFALFDVELETPRSMVVCGHYVQRTMAPYVSDKFVCLDSGCGTLPGAPLSILTLPERRVLRFTGEQEKP